MTRLTTVLALLLALASVGPANGNTITLVPDSAGQVRVTDMRQLPDGLFFPVFNSIIQQEDRYFVPQDSKSAVDYNLTYLQHGMVITSATLNITAVAGIVVPFNTSLHVDGFSKDNNRIVAADFNAPSIGSWTVGVPSTAGNPNPPPYAVPLDVTGFVQGILNTTGNAGFLFYVNERDAVQMGVPSLTLVADAIFAPPFAPEPSSVIILAVGMIGVGVMARRTGTVYSFHWKE